MKKLIITAAIVCAAAFTQAASYTWKAADSYIYSPANVSGDYPSVAQGTAVYLTFVSVYSQTDLVSDFANGSVNTAKFISGATTAVNAGGGISETGAWTYDTTANQSAYFVLFEGDKMFVSDVAAADYTAVGDSPIAFANQTDISDYEVFLGDAKAGYTQAGWYQAAAVPEPTSGLLLLLGVAGLALKRRRA